MLTDGGQSVTAHASAPLAQAVEDLQHTLGEGPGVDASLSGAAVLVPDLADSGDPALARWPTFARDAVDSGVLAAFAFPLLLGTARIGAMSLYRELTRRPELRAADARPGHRRLGGDDARREGRRATGPRSSGPDAGTPSRRDGDDPARRTDRPGAAAHASDRLLRGNHRGRARGCPRAAAAADFLRRTNDTRRKAGTAGGAGRTVRGPGRHAGRRLRRGRGPRRADGDLSRAPRRRRGGTDADRPTRRTAARRLVERRGTPARALAGAGPRGSVLRVREDRGDHRGGRHRGDP